MDYTYDRFGRVTQDGQLLYQYDRNGNRREVEYPGEVKALYTHDFADREATLTLQQPGEPDRSLVTAASYEPSGPLSSLSLGNGLMETRTFTSRYFPESIELSGVSTLFDWTYTQDNEGNVLAIVDGVAPAGNRSYTYQDHQYFLTAGVGPWGGITWTYDQIGNRLSEQRGALTDVYHYAPNAASGNTPLLEAVALGVGGTRDYTYGQAGHVEQVSADINETYFENAADSRLTRLERPAGDAATDFLYDGRSFLTRSIERSYDNLLTDGFEFGHTGCWTQLEGGVLGPQGPECFQQVTRPVYSSEGLLHALLKTNGPATTSESHYLLYFAGRPVLQLAVDAQGGSTYGYLTTDHLGTPAALCDETGTLLWQGGFEPFGADSFSGAGGAGVYLRFPGQWVDGTWEGSSAGEPVVYNVFRWYEVNPGRYASLDPLMSIARFAGDEPPEHYAYVYSRPSVLIDPLGLCALSPDMDLCLRFIFGESITKIRFTVKPRENSRWFATTRPGKIITYVSCEEFFASPEGVLEEYYHVLRQWNRGRMTRVAWLKETFRNGYDNNRFEEEAKDFVKINKDDFKSCLKCPPLVRVPAPLGLGGVFPP